MNKGGLVLRKHDANTLEERLQKISFQGSAIGGLCRALDVIDTIKAFDPCPNCRQEHDRLTTDTIIWSIRLAIESLAYNLACEGESMGDLVERGRIADERRTAQSPE